MRSSCWAKMTAPAAEAKAEPSCSPARFGRLAITWQNPAAGCGCGETASWTARSPASANGKQASTARRRALHQVPKDIVICDWHYGSAPPTALHFAVEGFSVVTSPWRRPAAALAQLELIRHSRKNASDPIASRALGVLQTTWCGMGRFVRAYFREGPVDRDALEAVVCFRALFEEIRKAGLK